MKLKNFCRECKKKLRITQSHEGYDEYTGKKIYVQYLHCPELRKNGVWKRWSYGIKNGVWALIEDEKHTFEKLK